MGLNYTIPMKYVVLLLIDILKIFPSFPFSFFVCFLKYILLIMMLQLSQYFHLCPLCWYPIPSSNPSIFSSYSWIVHLSSLVSPFPTLSSTPPWIFCASQLHFLIHVPLTTFSFSLLPADNPPNDPHIYSFGIPFHSCSGCMLTLFLFYRFTYW